MREALQAAIQYMFTTQRLHRIAAGYRPENVRSGRLLARLGFHIDGYSKNIFSSMMTGGIIFWSAALATRFNQPDW